MSKQTKTIDRKGLIRRSGETRSVARSLGHSRSSESTIAAREARRRDAEKAGQTPPRVWRLSS